ncbi:Enoyl-CoA hydratase/isomerase [Mycolicibacterium rhodesiae JS60]|nr:Enoyl-CoA hydratase/isomerase [Mycolicibacterium rhodesiae JS60]
MSVDAESSAPSQRPVGQDEKVSYRREGAVAYVTLNRPGKLNALDFDCLDLLARHIENAAGDNQVAAVVVSGNGRCFCAGADLKLVENALAEGTFDDFLVRWHEVFGVIEASPKPTIAAVHGFALAGGFELTQVCDAVVIGQSAVLGDQHANFGLFPGGGSTQRLPRLIPKRTALWMLYTGEPIDLQHALAAGLVNRVVPDEDVIATATEMAEMLAGRSSAATAAIKEAVRRGAALELDDALRLERSIAVAHMNSTDAAHGLAAFTNRTKTDFRGLRAAQISGGPPR